MTKLTIICTFKHFQGNTSMHYAVSHGNFDVVSILLDSKVCSINNTNNGEFWNSEFFMHFCSYIFFAGETGENRYYLKTILKPIFLENFSFNFSTFSNFVHLFKLFTSTVSSTFFSWVYMCNVGVIGYIRCGRTSNGRSASVPNCRCKCSS